MKLIDKSFEAERHAIKQVMQRLQAFTVRIQYTEPGQILADLRDRIDEPFMFVIVGEVKAGKSSFINALLEDPTVCAVAPNPMTDRIQQILYGETARVEDISPYFQRRYHPNEILQEIAIVDTPGTNTILAHHQEITERFVPGADLIVFVFEAKNPYRQSAWDFFDYIHTEWHKKIVFVLQQKDLLDASDLEINMNGLNEFARKKGLSKPVIFPVSAKSELDGNTAESGFAKLKDYIRDQITGGKARLGKLTGMIETLKQIVIKLSGGLRDRERQLDADIEFRKETEHTLLDHGQRSKHQADILIENILAAYDRIARKYEDELAESISFFSVLRKSISSIFSKSSSLKSWLEDFTKRLQVDFSTGIQDKINDSVLDLAESIQQMVHHIDLQIRNSKTVLANDHEMFAAIAVRRQNILRELRETFDQFVNHPESFTDKELVNTQTPIATNVAASSGLAVVGIILAAVAQGMVFDITGGVLTAVGFILAGITLGFQRGKVLRQFRKEMERGHGRLKAEMSRTLYAYIENLKDKINGQFAAFDDLIRQETATLDELKASLAEIEGDLEKIRRAL